LGIGRSRMPIVLTRRVKTSPLRTVIVAHQVARDSIDKALLMAAPVPEGKAN
jgi:hypothetical protein